jgi:hypothetical protein
MLWVFFWCMVVPLMLLVAGLSFVAYQTFLQEPYYSVAVDSVSGLDPLFGGGQPMLLDLEFNLTFRVASHGFWVRECAEPGIHVDVSYHGVVLASTMATTERTCARPRKAVDQHVVARGAGRVVVPGSLLDSLAEDMRHGVQVFDVELRDTAGKHANYTCGPRRVGDIVCALETECPMLIRGGNRGGGHW